MTVFHTPVLLKEALAYLDVRQGRKYIDATVGGGGHTAAIIRRGGVVLGIDLNPQAVRFAKERLAVELKIKNSKFKITPGNFKDIKRIAQENGFYPVAGILYDLGLSSYQLEHSGRGFSFRRDEPLDMRADPNLKVTATDLVNGLSVEDLTNLFRKYGEEEQSYSIARVIVSRRRVAPIKTSRQLADLVGGSDRAARIFQALRIAVNDELGNLQSSLPQAFEILERRGRLVVISFNSLEDRIVKKFFKAHGRELTKKPIIPTMAEIRANPRARSARLRALEK